MWRVKFKPVLEAFLACACCVGQGGGLSAYADPAPPLQPDPISIDRASPSAMPHNPASTSDVYGEVLGAGAGGFDAGGPGPVLHLTGPSFGVAALGSLSNVDGISNGELLFAEQLVVYFSVDDLSIGMPGTHVAHQATRRQAAGDRFVVNGFTTLPVTATVFGMAGPAAIAGPVFPGPINLLSANQTRYNEIPTIPPTLFNPYTSGLPGVTDMDDMDALELTPFDLNGDFVSERPVYLSLDAASPDLTPLGAGGGDILASPPGGGPLAVFAPAPLIGLTGGDEIDALAVWDVDGNLQATPQLDFAVFSLAPGSPTLTQRGWSPADVLATGFAGVPYLYLPATALGVLPTDNIDGLDVEPFLNPGSIEIWDEIVEPWAEADFDEDGDVDAADLARWQVHYGLVGAAHMQGDATGDGFVNGSDFLAWQRQYGGVPVLANDAAIPEPSAGLLGLGGVLGASAVRRSISNRRSPARGSSRGLRAAELGGR
ncbi:MAG: hypothetical protein KF847_17155 [Pirellulales bacterium]|nr:hypothetical protein [Pirellulales bacterium]